MENKRNKMNYNGRKHAAIIFDLYLVCWGVFLVKP